MGCNPPKNYPKYLDSRYILDYLEKNWVELTTIPQISSLILKNNNFNNLASQIFNLFLSNAHAGKGIWIASGGLILTGVIITAATLGAAAGIGGVLIGIGLMVGIFGLHGSLPGK